MLSLIRLTVVGTCRTVFFPHLFLTMAQPSQTVWQMTNCDWFRWLVVIFWIKLWPCLLS